MSFSRIILLAIIAAFIGGFFYFDLGHYLTLDALKSQQTVINDYYAQHPLLSITIYGLVYIVMTALSIPGALILTLAGGAIFGLVLGTVIVSFASTLGATFAFLGARFLFRDSVQKKLGSRLNLVNEGVRREGGFYLFTLRLVPIVPFFMINLLMGLTKMRVGTFYVVSQIGMLAGTAVYVNAGTQLAKIDSLAGILSPALLGSFALLGIFPLVAKKIVSAIGAKKMYKAYQKPKKFDNNIIVIGGGSAGLVTAYIAAAVKAKITLIEKHKMGGDCLNTGCVPSKALIKSSKVLSMLKRSKEFGINKIKADFNFSEVMERIQDIVATVAPHDSVQRYTELGVDVLTGEARIISPWEVEVKTVAGMQTISARSIVIAAGARPFVPPIPGLDKIDYLTSDNIWNLRTPPKRMLVLGGGPIGCELAQAFNRLGVQVIQVEMAARLMMREDEDVSVVVMENFIKEGVDIRLEHTAKEFIIENGEKILIAEYKGEHVKIPFDQVLLAMGRVANTKGYGLEELGVELTNRRTVQINDFQETNFPNIYACGDVSGPFQFTHTAAHQAWYASVNALFGTFKKFRTDYSVIPWATFTDPEVARVGLNEQEAKQKNIAYEISRYGIDDLDRAIADNEAYGFVKVLTVPGKDKILGVTIVGEHSGDLIAEFVLAMKYKLGLNKVLGTIHIYPTMAEANKYVAGVWKKNHQPKTLLQWVAKFHAWKRG